MIEITNLSVSYGPVRALEQVSMSIAEGETVAVLGANGAGKTSLLRTISGLVEPRQGEMRYEGKSIVGQSPQTIVRRGIAHVPEGRRVLGELTVKENLQLATAPWRRRNSSLDGDLARVHELFPVLDERQNQLAFSLSGGEQQMLAIGRALMARARVMLLDEPSLGLAPTLVQRVFDSLRDISNKGTTLLLVEQNARQALAIADRAYVLSQGKVVLDGTTEDLRQDPRIAQAYLGG